MASAEVLASPGGSVLAGWEQLALHLSAARQESVGGRFEPDGSFRGTRWLSIAEDPGGVDEPEWQSTKSEPSSADVAGLRTLVAELSRRSQ